MFCVREFEWLETYVRSFVVGWTASLQNLQLAESFERALDTGSGGRSL